MRNGISKWGWLIWIVMLASCGGGGGGGGGGATGATASILSGVAAVGAPIVNGNVSVVCASGGSPAPTTTSATGLWQLDLSGKTLPCAIEITGGTVLGVANLASYHSIATSAGNVNVTPISDLAVANLFQTSTPGTWFAGLSSNPSQLAAITPAQVNGAISNLSTAFSVLPFFTATSNPITTAFTPAPGNNQDDMLSALKTAMTNSGVNYTTLLGDASTTGFPTPSGFVSALKIAYLGTSSGTNVSYFPVSAPITNFNTTSISLALTGSYKGSSLTYSVSNTTGTASQTFMGQAANVSTTTGSFTISGALPVPISGTSYFSVGPYKSLGNVTSGAYTVFANQAALPTVAAIGMVGSTDTGTDYTDSTRSVILDKFVETWSMMAGPTSGTAYLCMNTVYTAVASTGISGTSSTCLNIDSAGNLLGVQLTMPINGIVVTMSSTSLLSVPYAPTISSVTPGADSATVNFAAPANTGGSPITGYTVTAIPGSSTILGNVTVTGTTSPIQIGNLTAGTAYTFTVAATNSMGTGNASAPSAPITPTVGAGFYVVTTFAGSGVAGNANGSGTAASFSGPGGVALDSGNNLYVADSQNNVIRKITPAGVVTTFAGSGVAGNADGSGTSASFNTPMAVAVDKGGNVYVADSRNNLIRMITPAGVVSTLAGSGATGSINGTGTAASFNFPTGIAVDNSGNVYVADSGNILIRKITPAGVVTTLAGSGVPGNVNGTGTAASFGNLGELAVDGNGNVYVADIGNSEIRMVTPLGVVSTFAGTGSCGYADGVGTAASFCQPYGISVDSVGNVYVSDTLVVRKITPAGLVSTLSAVAANTNGTVSNVTFAPTGLAIDASGNVYLSDNINNKIWKIILVP